MKKTDKIKNKAITLPIRSLNIRTRCSDKHYTLQSPHITGKMADIKGYILNVWYKTVPERSPLGLYLRIYTNSFSNYIPPVLIDNATNINSFTLDTTNDKALVTFVYHDEDSLAVKKWVYVDFDKQIMHKSEWGQATDELYISSFIADHAFILYESNAFYKYELDDTHYLITSSPYSGPKITSFLFASHHIGRAIYTENNTWYLVKIDTECNFINSPQLLAFSHFYGMNRGSNPIIYGYNSLEQRLNIYRDPADLNKVYNFNYNLSVDSSDISVHLDPNERVSVLEIFKQSATKTTLTHDGIVIEKHNSSFTWSSTPRAVLHPGNRGTWNLSEFYARRDTLTDSTSRGILAQVRIMIASRIAHLINEKAFPKMYYFKNKDNTIGVGYLNPNQWEDIGSCNKDDLTTLYAVASILGMPFEIGEINCYSTASSDNQLFFTDFYRASSYRADYSIEMVRRSLLKENDGGEWVVPKPATNCGNLLQCDEISLKNMYQTIYNEIRFKFNDLIDSTACAREPIECKNYVDKHCEVQRDIEISADSIRYVIEEKIVEVGRLLETWLDPSEL